MAGKRFRAGSVSDRCRRLTLYGDRPLAAREPQTRLVAQALRCEKSHLATTLLFYTDTDAPEPWRAAFALALPDMEFRIWPEVGEPARVTYALVWRPQSGLLARLPN